MRNERSDQERGYGNPGAGGNGGDGGRAQAGERPGQRGQGAQGGGASGAGGTEVPVESGGRQVAARCTEMGGERASRIYRANADVIQREREIVVLADMPGASAGSIDVRLEQGVLTLHGCVLPRQTDGEGWLLREYGVGDFHRSFSVGDDVDADGVTAEYEEGVLVVHLPRSERSRPRRIEVGARRPAEG